jgi:DNA-binding winged helix-turn-helix (wHTH) protein
MMSLPQSAEYRERRCIVLSELQRVMTAARPSSRVEFGGFSFDQGAGTLLKAGRAVLLSDKAAGALRLLLRNRPNTVRKEEFLDVLWPGADVEENSVAAVIADLRKALSDSRETPQFVLTDFGNGYRFIAEVRELDDTAAPAGTTQCWVQWRDQRFKLGEGENLVGRDPRHPVWLDHPTVSRVHAAILVRDSEVTVEDRSSLHGTFVDDVRVSAAHPLAEGDAIRFGGTTVVFRRSDTRTVPTIDQERLRGESSKRASKSRGPS